MKPCLKPQMLSNSRKKNTHICRKQLNGGFKCPYNLKNMQPSNVLAISFYPKSHDSLLIDSSGSCQI